MSSMWEIEARPDAIIIRDHAYSRRYLIMVLPDPDKRIYCRSLHSYVDDTSKFSGVFESWEEFFGRFPELREVILRSGL